MVAKFGKNKMEVVGLIPYSKEIKEVK